MGVLVEGVERGRWGFWWKVWRGGERGKVCEKSEHGGVEERFEEYSEEILSTGLKCHSGGSLAHGGFDVRRGRVCLGSGP